MTNEQHEIECRRHLMDTFAVASGAPFASVVKLRQLIDDRVFRSGHTVFAAGNGGGGTVMEHFTLGLTLNVLRESHRSARAVCLNASGVVLSSAMNDFGPDRVFSAQLETLGRANDVLVAFSGSGSSENIAQAVMTARQLHMTTVAIVGAFGPVCECADIVIDLKTSSNAIAEDVAIQLLHWLYCSFFGKA